MTAEEFIAGLKQLRLKSPRISVSGYQNINCPYGDAIYVSKNCYLCFVLDSSEECMYCGLTQRSRYCVDCEYVYDSELCYEGIEFYNCYNCNYSQSLRDSSDCQYSYDLLNCHNCFGCVGLRRKSHNIFNRQYSPEEYASRMAVLKNTPSQEIRYQVEELRRVYPHVAARQYNTENSFGDNIQHSKDCFCCFNSRNVHGGAYLYEVYTEYGERNEEAYDCWIDVDLFHCYECVQVGDAWNCNFCNYCEHLKDSEFCEGCFNSKYLFGCTFTNRREYMILNKPYSKEDWHKTTEEIKRALVAENKYNWDVFGQ